MSKSKRTSVDQEVAANLKRIVLQWKQNTNLDYNFIAEKLDVTHATISHFVNGQISINRENLQKLAVVLGCNVWDIDPKIVSFCTETEIKILTTYREILGFLTGQDKELFNGSLLKQLATVRSNLDFELPLSQASCPELISRDLHADLVRIASIKGVTTNDLINKILLDFSVSYMREMLVLNSDEWGKSASA